jgi:DNA-binding FadR family transcriptional regulator
VVQVVHPQSTDDAATREKVKAAILNQLEQRGGSLGKSERGIAALIGASRPTVRRAINGLGIAGLIAAEASRNGTMLRLVS